MKRQTNHVLVGLFVLLLGGGAVVTGVWLGFGAPEHLTNLYATYMTDSVSGLRLKSAVRYRGVDVGRVRAIGLDPEDSERVRLLLDIDDEVPIRTTTVARLARQGVTGLAFVELRGGSADAPLLEAAPGQRYPVIQSEPSLVGRLTEAGDEMLARVEATVTSLALASERIAALFDERNRDAVAATLANVERVAAAAGARADTLGTGIDDLGRVMAAAAAAGERLPALVGRADATLAGLERHAAALADAARALTSLVTRLETEVGPLAASLDRTTALGEQELARFASETQPALAALLRELADAAASLRGVADALERDPSLLLHGRRDRLPGPGEEGYPR